MTRNPSHDPAFELEDPDDEDERDFYNDSSFDPREDV